MKISFPCIAFQRPFPLLGNNCQLCVISQISMIETYSAVCTAGNLHEAAGYYILWQIHFLKRKMIAKLVFVNKKGKFV